MLSCFILTILLGFPIRLLVAIPYLPSVPDSPLIAPSASSDLAIPLHSSASPDNSSFYSANILKLGCDYNRYGRNLKVKSCRDLFGYLKPDEEQYTFSERDSGIHPDIPLPFRAYSSELTALKIEL